MKLNNNNAGLAAEKVAETFLTNHGLKLVANNYHCRYGEIDLIMYDGITLVFVEVRLRSNSRFGSPASSITLNKQRKLIHAAQHYLQRHPIKAPCRFDAILLDNNNHKNIEWLRNAFET